jgi:hypothetical protein
MYDLSNTADSGKSEKHGHRGSRGLILNKKVMHMYVWYGMVWYAMVWYGMYGCIELSKNALCNKVSSGKKGLRLKPDSGQKGTQDNYFNRLKINSG